MKKNVFSGRRKKEITKNKSKKKKEEKKKKSKKGKCESMKACAHECEPEHKEIPTDIFQ
jgi:hypothetical protein